MFRTLLPLTLLFSASALAAGTPGTIEYFVQNDVNGRPYAVGRVPNKPWPTTASSPSFTFGTMTRPVGTAVRPTYMPQRITPASFARGMFNAIVRGHPVAKAAVVGWAVYECATAESGLCSGGQVDESCPGGGTYYEGFSCGVPYEEETELKWVGQCEDEQAVRTEITGDSFEEINLACHQQNSGNELPGYCRTDNYRHVDTRTIADLYYVHSNPVYGCTVFASTAVVGKLANWAQVPVSSSCPEAFPSGPVDIDGIEICFAPPPDGTEVKDVTLDDLKDWIAENPNILDDMPDDVLKDPTTGKPDDTFFDKPKHTPISPPLSEAFENLGTGLAQDTNPNAPGYISPDVKPEVEEARDKFHEGEPFTDPFTDTTVTPDPAPSEPAPYVPPTDITVTVEQSWEGFPGITQDQYEQSNNSWASDLAGRLPQEETDWTTFDDDFKDSISNNPDLPFEPFNFATLWPITGGQCTGFARTVSVAGTTKTIMFDRHCPPYNEWAHPFLSWFLQILAALQILTIFNRTILSGAN